MRTWQADNWVGLWTQVPGPLTGRERGDLSGTASAPSDNHARAHPLPSFGCSPSADSPFDTRRGREDSRQYEQADNNSPFKGA